MDRATGHQPRCERSYSDRRLTSTVSEISPRIALYVSHVNQNAANQVAGTSACSSGTQTVAFPRHTVPRQ